VDLGGFVDDLKANSQGFDRMIERVPDVGSPPEQNKLMAGQFLAGDMRLSSEGVACWAEYEKLICDQWDGEATLVLGAVAYDRYIAFTGFKAFENAAHVVVPIDDVDAGMAKFHFGQRGREQVIHRR